jgi:Lipopolysaccharide-assembly
LSNLSGCLVPGAWCRVRAGAWCLVGAWCMVLAAGCGYSLAGRGSFLPESIKTIGVPMFANHTSVFELERRVTEKVRSELIGRGRYKVLPDSTGVDGLLIGEITGVTLAPASFTEQRQASRIVVVMTAKIEFKDTATGKVLWSNPSLQFREEYEVTTGLTAFDPNAFFEQNTNAYERMSTNFARSIVSAILEAF